MKLSSKYIPIYGVMFIGAIHSWSGAVQKLLTPSISTVFHFNGKMRSNIAMNTEGSLSSRIKNGLSLKFPSCESTRVVDCFNRFLYQQDLDILLGDGKDSHNRQQANCWVKDVEPVPFHDINNGKFEWVLEMEKSAHLIRQEFQAYVQREAAKGSNQWLSARNTDGLAYGPEWKTLGLMDRNIWDEENMQVFPETVKLLTNLNVPACEAFFARQGANSGILPHSDFNNFILTAHIGIDVPEGQCWIKVGDQTRYWANEKGMVFDTSIFHSTRNDADTDRYVLLIRFWHPDLTPVEVQALSFIFDFLNVAQLGDAAVNNFEAEHVYGILSTPSTPSTVEPAVSTANSEPINGEEALQGETRQARRERARKEKKSTGVDRAKGFHRGK
jgi:hypothetical protein